ncbi:MAG: 4Fe-4S binding protein [Tissierellia bacterium]|nr:ATP-binding protein [Bacillota bacterium]NLL22940.1 4Fe-4S binding protein [Tissierellia bacterium]
MKIAVLSGKGGTGKTFIAVNLAAAAKASTYVDCDVEEPNGHLFLKPEHVREQEISVKIPVVDHEKCNGCRKCVDFCNFNALAYINNKLRIFDDVCHSCGGCLLVCPEDAFTEKDKVVGKVQRGISDNVIVWTGILNTGEATGIPIISELLNASSQEPSELTFIDSPPGSSCIVMESIKEADYCILVAEPTIFGVHNLNMVYELVTLFDKPFGVILNKCLGEDNPAEAYCMEKNLPILGRISFDSELGTLNANAEVAFRNDERYRELFSSLLETVTKEVPH